MPTVEFKPGAKFNFLDHHELGTALSNHTASWFKEMARGLKHMVLPAQLGTVASSAISIPALGTQPVGPQPGFVWAIQRLSIVGLSTNDVVGIYRNTADPMNYLGQLTATSPSVYPGDKGMLLKDGDRLVFANIGSLSATGQLVVTGEFIECAEIDIWKLIGGS